MSPETYRRWLRTIARAEHNEIACWLYKHAPDVKGPYRADDALDAWAEFGVGLNDCLMRSLDPTYQPAWPECWR